MHADDDEGQEFSEGGSPIYRHKPRETPFQLPEQQAANLEAIEKHLVEFIGPVETVFHEIVSDLVHLDVLFIKATDERPYHVVCTSGISDMPMTVPEGLEDFRRAELLMALPTDWPLTEKDFNDEANYWPIRWLKQIGRLPHEYQTWIGWGHTIPNGDPAEPIANTKFTGFILEPPIWLPQEFFQLKPIGGDTINFYHVVPLYQEEMDLKLKSGAEKLEELFDKNHTPFVLDPQRRNVAARKGWFW